MALRGPVYGAIRNVLHQPTIPEALVLVAIAMHNVANHEFVDECVVVAMSKANSPAGARTFVISIPSLGQVQNV